MHTDLSATVVAPPAVESDLRAGARAMVPVVIAYAPLGLLVGAHAAASSNPAAAWIGTWLIYGGAAQLAVLDVLAHGSGWVAAAVVGVLVNVRLAAFATAMHPEWRSAPLRRRIAAAVMLTDAPWVVARNRPGATQQYYLGAAISLFVVWPLMVSVGVLVGGRVDATPTASLLLPLTLGAVVVPQLRQRPAAVAIVTAAACAVVTLPLSTGLALAVTGIVGGLAGVLTERAS